MYVEYKRDVGGNYLIIHEDESVNMSSYQARMLMGNDIPSVLKCRMQGLDGKTLIYYDITSKQSVASFYEQRKLRGEDLVMIFTGFIKIMEEMAEFLMNHEQLLLCPEYMFIDIEKRKIYFCCLPNYGHPIQEQLRELTEYFLPKLDHEDPDAVSLGYGIYRLAMEPGIQLESIKESVYRFGNSSKNNFENISQNKIDDNRENSCIDSDAADIQLDENELFYEGVRREEAHINEEKSSNNKAKKNKRIHWDKLKDFKIKWVIICLVGVLILSLVAFAGYQGYIVQVPVEIIIGLSIIILSICAIASWIEEKNRKKNEETAEWRQKVKKELSRESDDQINESIEDEAKGEFIMNHPEFEEIPASEKSMEFGETVVLSAGKIKGPSSLVSREPGELPTVYLENELTVVGKLENASDTVIPLPTVSRVHARIRRVDDEYYLADLNSRNGTTVNGRLLKPGEEYQLMDEDQVDFAQARYIFLK